MPIKPEMKPDADFRFAAQITDFCSEWEDNVLFDEDDPDFANSAGVTNRVNNGGGCLRPAAVSQATAAACVLNSLMLKGKLKRQCSWFFIVVFVR